MKRTFAIFLVAGLVALSTGCAHCGWVYRPFGPGTLCTGAPCDGCCGGCSDCATPACAPCATPACSACEAPTPAACSCETTCDTCETACGGPCASPCGPLTWLFNLLNCGYCGDGCGEIWWGDFHGAPPTCCEPCNRLGEWTGQPGSGMPMNTGGCSSCGGGQTMDYTFQQQPRVLADSDSQVGPAPVLQAAKPITAARR
jgi:hypothetical protein